MLDSNMMKYAVMKFARHNKNWRARIVLPEYMYGYTDVFILRKDMRTVDVEIKISMADLKRELKKTKHRYIQNGIYHDNKPMNYYYIAVPQILFRKAKPFITENFPYAGIIVIDSSLNVVIKRNPKKIHDYLFPENRMKRVWMSQNYRLIKAYETIAKLSGGSQ